MQGNHQPSRRSCKPVSSITSMTYGKSPRNIGRPEFPGQADKRLSFSGPLSRSAAVTLCEPARVKRRHGHRHGREWAGQSGRLGRAVWREPGIRLSVFKRDADGTRPRSQRRDAALHDADHAGYLQSAVLREQLVDPARPECHRHGAVMVMPHDLWHDLIAASPAAVVLNERRRRPS